MTIELEHISRNFASAAAVRDISLSVPEGEFLALVGPSGAGKTTLLRIIAGLEQGYSGRLSIHGRDVTAVPARDRNIGFMFQSYALFRHMSVFENVAFGLRVRPRATRPGRAEIAQQVRELLALVQVAELERRMPAQLSGGQRQRVALARALATNPQLLLLDEPFGALDPLVRKDIRTWLRALHNRLGLTSIFVTHDQAEALEVADRIAVLRGGALEQIGTPEALEATPASPFVYSFLGEANRFSGVIENGALRLDDIPEFQHHSAARAADGRVNVLVRPHNLRLRGGGGPAEITSAIVSGGYTRYIVALRGRRLEAWSPAGAPAIAVGTPCAFELVDAKIFAENTSDLAALTAAPEHVLAAA